MFTGTATPKLGLPQWNPTDHPDFLTDLNQAFKDIDKNASDTSEEIAGYPQRLEELETLTQSINEDTQQLITDMSSAQVAIANLKTESAKIDPMQAQIQVLQNTDNEQDDAIMNLNDLEATYAIGNVTAHSGDLSINISEIRRIGNTLRVLVEIDNIQLSPNSVYHFELSEEDAYSVWNALNVKTENYYIFAIVVRNLFNSSGECIGRMFIEKFTKNEFILNIQSVIGGYSAIGGTYPISMIVPKGDNT